MYHEKCPCDLCSENYVHEIDKHFAESIKGLSEKNNSQKLKHLLDVTGHEHVEISDFSVVFKNFH